MRFQNGLSVLCRNDLETEAQLVGGMVYSYLLWLIYSSVFDADFDDELVMINDRVNKISSLRIFSPLGSRSYYWVL